MSFFLLNRKPVEKNIIFARHARITVNICHKFPHRLQPADNSEYRNRALQAARFLLVKRKKSNNCALRLGCNHCDCALRGCGCYALRGYGDGTSVGIYPSCAPLTSGFHIC
jgi:hypothetical protein